MKDNRNIDQILESWTDDPSPSAPAMIQDAIDEAYDDDAVIDEDAAKDVISAATDLMGNGTGIGNTAKMFINAVKANDSKKAKQEIGRLEKEFKTMTANMAKVRAYTG